MANDKKFLILTEEGDDLGMVGQALERRVTSALIEGWAPVGGVSVSSFTSFGVTRYALVQAVATAGH